MKSRIDKIKEKVVDFEIERMKKTRLKMNISEKKFKEILMKAWGDVIEDTIKETIKIVREDLMRQLSLPEEVYYYFKEKWGLK